MIITNKELDFLYDGLRLNMKCLKDTVNTLDDSISENDYDSVDVFLKDIEEWTQILKENQKFIKTIVKEIQKD